MAIVYRQEKGAPLTYDEGDGNFRYLDYKRVIKTTDPTVNDDANAGFYIGARWLNTTTGITYECKDATAGNAVWEQVVSGALTLKDSGWVLTDLVNNYRSSIGSMSIDFSNSDSNNFNNFSPIDDYAFKVGASGLGTLMAGFNITTEDNYNFSILAGDMTAIGVPEIGAGEGATTPNSFNCVALGNRFPGAANKNVVSLGDKGSFDNNSNSIMLGDHNGLAAKRIYSNTNSIVLNDLEGYVNNNANCLILGGQSASSTNGSIIAFNSQFTTRGLSSLNSSLILSNANSNTSDLSLLTGCSVIADMALNSCQYSSFFGYNEFNGMTNNNYGHFILNFPAGAGKDVSNNSYCRLISQGSKATYIQNSDVIVNDTKTLFSINGSYINLSGTAVGTIENISSSILVGSDILLTNALAGTGVSRSNFILGTTINSQLASETFVMGSNIDLAYNGSTNSPNNTFIFGKGITVEGGDTSGNVSMIVGNTIAAKSIKSCIILGNNITTASSGDITGGIVLGDNQTIGTAFDISGYFAVIGNSNTIEGSKAFVFGSGNTVTSTVTTAASIVLGSNNSDDSNEDVVLIGNSLAATNVEQFLFGSNLTGDDGNGGEFIFGKNNTVYLELFPDMAEVAGKPIVTEDGGPTTSRPASPRNYQFYFDTDLNKPIWFNGTDWVDATGTVV